MRRCALILPALLTAVTITLGPVAFSSAQAPLKSADHPRGHHVRTLQHRIDLRRQHSLIRDQARPGRGSGAITTAPAAALPPVRQRPPQAPVQLDHSRNLNPAIADLVTGRNRLDTRPEHRLGQQPGQRPRLSTGEALSPTPRVVRPQPYRQLVIRPVRDGADLDMTHRPIIIYSATAYAAPKPSSERLEPKKAPSSAHQHQVTREPRRDHGPAPKASSPPVRVESAQEMGRIEKDRETSPSGTGPYDTAVAVEPTPAG